MIVGNWVYIYQLQEVVRGTLPRPSCLTLNLDSMQGGPERSPIGLSGVEAHDPLSATPPRDAQQDSYNPKPTTSWATHPTGSERARRPGGPICKIEQEWAHAGVDEPLTAELFDLRIEYLSGLDESELPKGGAGLEPGFARMALLWPHMAASLGFNLAAPADGTHVCRLGTLE